MGMVRMVMAMRRMMQGRVDYVMRVGLAEDVTETSMIAE